MRRSTGLDDLDPRQYVVRDPEDDDWSDDDEDPDEDWDEDEEEEDWDEDEEEDDDA